MGLTIELWSKSYAVLSDETRMPVAISRPDPF